MSDLFSFGLLSFTSLFTIIDPIAAAPIFVAMTEDYEARARRIAALKACGIALLILIIFAVGGSLIFKTFGITIDALRIAGGILFFAMSMQMLMGHSKQAKKKEEASIDPAIVPLGIPMICGPGAISTVMVMIGQHRSGLHIATFFLALVLVIAVTALVLMIAPRIVGFIGRTGIEVVTRIIGLIVCTIGIQFIIDGVRPVAISILSSIR